MMLHDLRCLSSLYEQEQKHPDQNPRMLDLLYQSRAIQEAPHQDPSPLSIISQTSLRQSQNWVNSPQISENSFIVAVFRSVAATTAKDELLEDKSALIVPTSGRSRSGSYI